MSSSLQAAPPTQRPTAQFALIQDGQKVTLENKPPVGSKLSLCLKAHRQPCQIFLAQFAGNGSEPAPGFKPKSLRLEAEDVDEIPLQACNGQLFVVVAEPDSRAAQNLTAWTQNWNDKRKRTAMHDALGAWLQNREANSVGKAGKLPVELGGTVPTSAEGGHVKQTGLEPAPPQPVLRSRDVPQWLKVADSLTGTGDKPGVFVYQIEVKGRR